MTDEQRLTELETLFNNFTIVGEGIDVSGSLSKGYVANCETCPDVDPLPED